MATHSTRQTYISAWQGVCVCAASCPRRPCPPCHLAMGFTSTYNKANVFGVPARARCVCAAASTGPSGDTARPLPLYSPSWLARRQALDSHLCLSTLQPAAVCLTMSKQRQCVCPPSTPPPTSAAEHSSACTGVPPNNFVGCPLWWKEPRRLTFIATIPQYWGTKPL